MRYKLFGKSGLRVSELCLGVMTFGEEAGIGASKEECRKIFDTFVEAGGNFFDTADVYTNGTSEKWLGEFIASDRERFVVATKYSNATRKDPNAFGNHRKHMMESIEGSLKRLNTDYIDIYWIHAWDYTTPVEEVMRALDDAVRAGKIMYVGISNTPAWIVSRANMMAELMGWTQFIGLQIEYNVIKRTVEREFLPMARALDLGVACWQPLGGGYLTGDPEELKIRLENGGVDPYAQREMAIATEVVNFAREIGRSPAQVALNWLRQLNGVVIPIIGARKVAHIKDNLACLDFSLTKEQLKHLDTVGKVELGYPYDFGKAIRDTYAGTLSLIDNHHRIVGRRPSGR